MIRFEWDLAKNEINRFKHGIDFETAALVFDDVFGVSFIERVVDGEERWHSIGSVEGLIVLAVVHTYREEGREEVIRIISARRATAHERKLYAEAIKRETEGA